MAGVGNGLSQAGREKSGAGRLFLDIGCSASIVNEHQVVIFRVLGMQAYMHAAGSKCRVQT